MNIYTCCDLTTKVFLAALQTQVLREGLPAEVYSDLGTQIVAGSRAIKDFLSSEKAQAFLKENGVKSPKFHQYSKGNPAHGALVESCVKMVKKLFYSSIRNGVLELTDFQFVIEHIVHIVNKRPIAYHEALRDNSTDEVLPEIITPEILVKGREIKSINIVPELEDFQSTDVEQHSLVDSLSGVRQRLATVYNEQLRQTLITNATNVRGRYRTMRHFHLQPGDIVLVSDPSLKSYNFPMAIVVSTSKNSLGEVTDAVVARRHDRLKMQRHVSCLIPLLRSTVT